MRKRILITGSTDGIGLVAAEKLCQSGHHVILHGRNANKLEDRIDDFKLRLGEDSCEGICADLSSWTDLRAFRKIISTLGPRIDVFVNNAGVFKSSQPILDTNLDLRFMVNTLAPYVLSKAAMEMMCEGKRIINLSSAAQASVDIQALRGDRRLNDNAAYAQSKLALTMFTTYLAKQNNPKNQVVVSLNPASFIGTNMVRDAYGMEGKDINIGGDIIVDTSIGERFANANGMYFDNDRGDFSDLHPDVHDEDKVKTLIRTFDEIVGEHL